MVGGKSQSSAGLRLLKCFPHLVSRAFDVGLGFIFDSTLGAPNAFHLTFGSSRTHKFALFSLSSTPAPPRLYFLPVFGDLPRPKVVMVRLNDFLELRSTKIPNCRRGRERRSSCPAPEARIPGRAFQPALATLFFKFDSGLRSLLRQCRKMVVRLGKMEAAL